MSSPTEECFLKEIIARPTEPLPRLMFADWLDEQGDARAYLIRLQVEYARRMPLDPQREVIRQEARGLLSRYRRRWMRAVRSRQDLGYRFHGGLLEEVRLNPEAFFRDWISLRDQVPTLSRIWFRRVRGRMAEILESSVWQSHPPGFLDVSLNQLSPQDAQALRRFSPPASLWGLRFRCNLLDRRSVRMLGRSPWAAPLEHLDLSETGIEDGGMKLLFQEQQALPVRKLNLSTCGLTGEALDGLLRAGRFPRLERLSLANNHLENEAVDAFVGSVTPELRHLDLSGNGLTDEGIEWLCESEGLTNLQSLNLSGMDLGPQTVRQILKTDSFPNLKFLRLPKTTRSPVPNRPSSSPEVRELQARFGEGLSWGR